MGQSECLKIVDMYGDLKNSGEKLEVVKIREHYKKMYGDLGKGSINVALKKLRECNLINCDWHVGNKLVYWKRYDDETGHVFVK